jgi:predicted nucleic acid-binding protein
MAAVDHGVHRPALMIHLDTNFLIDALVPDTPQGAQLEAWLAAGKKPGISAVAWGEFLCGPLSNKAEAFERGAPQGVMADAYFPGCETAPVVLHHGP